MAKAVPFIICLGLLGLALPALPADDDLTSSAYLVFDPETGEFVTVHDPDRTKQDHAASDPANVASNQPPAGAEAGGQVPPVAIGVTVAILLLAAAVWAQSKKRKAS